MTTNTKKTMIIISLAVLGYLLYTEYKKNKAVPAPATDPGGGGGGAGGGGVAPETGTQNNIVVGDHTGMPAMSSNIQVKSAPIVQNDVNQLYYHKSLQTVNNNLGSPVNKPVI